MRPKSRVNTAALSLAGVLLSQSLNAVEPESLFQPGKDITVLTKELSHRLLTLDSTAHPSISYKDQSTHEYRAAEVQVKVGNQLYHILVAEPKPGVEGSPIMDLQTVGEKNFGVIIDRNYSRTLLLPHPADTSANAIEAQVDGVTTLTEALDSYLGRD